MSIEKHVEEFLEALNGGRGTLDAWLECNNEAECRTAINGAIAAEREACAKVCDEIALRNQQTEGTYSAGKKAGAFECANSLRSNAEITGRTLAQNEADGA